MLDIVQSRQTIGNWLLARTLDNGLAGAPTECRGEVGGLYTDHHHVIPSSGLGLFFVLVFYSGWFFVFGLLLCYMFLTQKHVLPVRAPFFD